MCLLKEEGSHRLVRPKLLGGHQLDSTAKRMDEAVGTVTTNAHQPEVAVPTQHTVESTRYNERTRSSVG